MKKNIIYFILIFSFKIIAQAPGWLYNQPISITNSNLQNAVNYQMQLTINTQSLISAGQMSPSGNDIRFTGTCTGNIFYNYWIQSGINTPTTIIWVKIPLIAANTTTTIFMSYGNPAAIAQSTIQGTFRGPNSATDSVSGGTSGGNLVCQRGFRFQPTQNLLVTHFGKNEPTGSTRYVTLFNYGNQAIISQTQVAGPSASYTYGPISSPIWLNPATQYVLQIYGLANDGYYYGSSSQIGQHLTYYDMQYSNGGTQNTFPTNVLSNYHYGYGDFLYYITSTLAITPSYTLAGGLINISGPSSICANNTITLTTNATGTYSWNTAATSSFIVVSPSITTSYSVAQTNTIGCNSVALITVTVNSTVPIISINSSTNSICPTNTVILTAAGAINYTWTGGVSNGVAFSPLATSNYTVSGSNGCGTSTALTSVTVTPLPVIAISSSSAVCAGNTATLSAGGALTYTWMPGNILGPNIIVSPLVSVIYTLTGTTPVCAGVYTLSLIAKPNPTVTTSASNSLICAGAQVTLTAFGASTYTWQSGPTVSSSLVVSPTAPTAYQVSGTNSLGCSSNSTQVVLVNPSPIINVIASETLICAGGSSTLTASGGSNYTWNFGPTTASVVVSPTANTVYSVTSAGVGCNTTQTISVDVFTQTLTVSNSTAICMGSSVTLNASGGTTYLWSNGGTGSSIFVYPSVSTLYTVSAVTVINNMSCNSTGSVNLTINPNPTVTAVLTRSVICRGESTILTANGANTYVWNNTATTQSFAINPIINTNYTVTGTNLNGCKGTGTVQVKVNTCTGISELNNQNGLTIYPNPNNGEFTIESQVNINLELINELGQFVRLIKLSEANNRKINISELSNGIYFLIGKKDNLKVKQKIIVTK